MASDEALPSFQTTSAEKEAVCHDEKRVINTLADSAEPDLEMSSMEPSRSDNAIATSTGEITSEIVANGRDLTPEKAQAITLATSNDTEEEQPIISTRITSINEHDPSENPDNNPSTRSYSMHNGLIQEEEEDRIKSEKALNQEDHESHANNASAPGTSMSPLSSSNTSVSGDCKSTNVDLEANVDKGEQWIPHIKGWRFWAVNLALGVGIFLSQMETTIVSTSLVSITNDLKGFQEVSWIVTSYLVTYTGFLAIISKMSDIFGRKSLTLISFSMFIIFSLGCGFAQTLNQLVIMRAFQGIGGGGIYAMAYVIFPDMGGPKLYAMYAAYLSLMAALACLLGPLVGGAINDSGSWKWVFWINVPIGLVSLILILIALPRNFPKPSRSSHLALPRQPLKAKLARIDFLGMFLVLAASVLLVTALEEGGTAYSWTNAIPLACIIISAFLWSGFVFWQKFLDSGEDKSPIESTFPWRLMVDRFTMGALWNAFFVGGMFLTLAIALPQRFQVVHGDSPFVAGVRILPLTLSLPLGTICSGLLQTKLRVAPLYTFMAGGFLHTLGIGLLGSITVVEVPSTVYGYQIIAGFGLGLSLATCIMTIPLVVAKKDSAVAMGSIGQFRMLGGAVILAIFANVLNPPVSDQLSSVLSAEQLSALLQSAANISRLSPGLQAQVIGTYESGYQKQLRVLIAFSIGAVLASLLLFERKPRRQKEAGELS